ncbi:glutamate formimidoyltransferase [Thermoplasmatales archaeon ex4484_6]|nr:MAG: glutamate formimidoyltransferase [Thermoplasmatales archaeon ex4484_6]
MEKIVECVPNFSEGRDRSIIDAIAGAVSGTDGVKLLDVDPGADFNRTVFTFVGGPEEVLEAAFRAAKVGMGLIDMRKHSGEHARMGALDVCPFIPIKGVTFEECTELAVRFGKRVWEELGVPGFLYARSARRPDRVRLPDIRKGEYEALEEKFSDPSFAPDFGEPVFVPRSGTFATGARPILIAYNVNLDTSDKSVASKIAGRIRTSGVVKKDADGNKIMGPDGKPERIPGYLKEVQAGGMMYNENIAQVSMNLLDYEQCNLHDAFEACRKEAEDLGVNVTGSEIVGLVPEEALVIAGRFYAGREGLKRDDTEDLVSLAISRLGLDQLYKFEPDKKIIDRMVAEKNRLAGMGMKDFLDELASSSPAPGGGSVAALSGSLGAALNEMVCQLTLEKEKLRDSWDEVGKAVEILPGLRKRLLELVDEDTDAFNDVIKAFRMPKGTDEEKRARSEAIQAGYRKAIATPMETASGCLDILEQALRVSTAGNPNSITDVAVGALMASSGLDGAVLNVRINLGSIKDAEYVERTEGELSSMITRRDELLSLIMKNVNERM